LQETIASKKTLDGMDPLHAVYIYGQNMMSVLIEQIIELPVLDKFGEAYSNAEDEYQPMGPPMSPLTVSYFTCWAFFDLCFGLARETLATITIELGKVMNY